MTDITDMDEGALPPLSQYYAGKIPPKSNRSHVNIIIIGQWTKDDLLNLQHCIDMFSGDDIARTFNMVFDNKQPKFSNDEIEQQIKNLSPVTSTIHRHSGTNEQWKDELTESLVQFYNSRKLMWNEDGYKWSDLEIAAEFSEWTNNTVSIGLIYRQIQYLKSQWSNRATVE
jgi:hypothetical protein